MGEQEQAMTDRQGTFDKRSCDAVELFSFTHLRSVNGRSSVLTR